MMSTNGRLAVAVAVAAGVVVVLAVQAWPKASREVAAVTSHTVVYEADGVGTAEGSITLEAPTGTQQVKAALPLRTKAGATGLTYPGFKSGAFVYLSVQNQSASGSVTCRILVDGTPISENTSSGGYVIASCQGRVP